MRGLLEDSEFKIYLKNLSIMLSGAKDYAMRMRIISTYLTAFAGEETERCFTETQLKQIFALANKE